MTTTVDTLTVVTASHLGPTFLGRLAERNGGVVVVTINAALNSNQSQLEHNKNLKRESERTGAIIAPES